MSFERLEERAMLSVMRLASWNTLNGPNDAAGQAAFATVLAAIGEAPLAGNAKRIDLLALQETDTPLAGGDSITAIELILEELYPSINYASAFSGLDGGGDATGFVYDTTTLQLLESVVVEPSMLTHQVLRAKFRPDATLGESDFYVYSVHLKSGTSSSDATIRESEAALLRADADALGEGANVLFVGDFNWQGASQVAYQTFVAAGAGQVQDVAGAPGEWKDNAAFLSLHTQSPRDAMDDRFDMQMASGEFFDGVGIDYIVGSYGVLGNNGTHGLNQPITTGTGASPEVLAALVAASDHLPTIADYSFSSAPGIAIRETGSGTRVIEGGQNDTYSVVLNTVPQADVLVTLSPDSQLDLGAGAGVPVQLIFTPANALTRQTVVVTAVNDVVGEGNHQGLITHISSSSDSDYHALAINGVTALIVDDDAPTIYINELDSDTEGVDALEFVELYDGGVGGASLSGISLVFFNGANDTEYRVIDLAGFTTDANGFFVVGNVGVANVDLVIPNNSLQNGADAVALYQGLFPSGGTVADLTGSLLDAVVYDTDDADDPELLTLLVAGGQVNENQTGAKDFVAIARVPDGGALRSTTGFVLQTPTPGTLNLPDLPGVTITQSGPGLNLQEGGTADSYQIVLDTPPAANVTITVQPDPQSDVGAGAGVSVVLVFNPLNYNVPQTVSVTAVDDAAVEGDHATTITHQASSSDPSYDNLLISQVVGSILDNDAAPTPTVVITELMYDPASVAGGREGEWVEIVNVGAASVDLTGWLLDDEDASNWAPIPAGVLLAPGQVAVLIDAAYSDAATFRAEWGVPAEALVIGIGWGNLANTPNATDNEVLELRDAQGVLIDLVNYDDASPWPSNNNAASVYLTGLGLDNNVGSSWARSMEGDSGALSPIGPVFSVLDVGSPGKAPGAGILVPLAGDYNGDNVVDAADYTVWRDNLGLAVTLLNDTSPGSVGPEDYAVWKEHFGTSLAAIAAVAPLAPVAAGGDVAALAVWDLALEGYVAVPAMSGTSSRTALAAPVAASSGFVPELDRLYAALATVGRKPLVGMQRATDSYEDGGMPGFADDLEWFVAELEEDELASTL